MESNKSLSAAAAREAEKQVQVLRATGEAPEEAIAPGGYPTRGAALGGPRKTVHFSDDEANPPAACQNRHATAGASAPDLAPGAAASSQVWLNLFRFCSGMELAALVCFSKDSLHSLLVILTSMSLTYLQTSLCTTLGHLNSLGSGKCSLVRLSLHSK